MFRFSTAERSHQVFYRKGLRLRAKEQTIYPFFATENVNGSQVKELGRFIRTNSEIL